MGESSVPLRVAQADPRRRPAVAHHRGLPARPTRHPLSPDSGDLDAVRRHLATRRAPTAIDLFCGAGGLSLGLTRAGFDVIIGADVDEWSVRTHDANIPGLSWTGDLSVPDEFLAALDVWGVQKVDLVAGGVPCQPFSRAGSSRIRRLVEDGERTAHDERADLWASFVAVVERTHPTAVLVENVPDLPRWDDGAVLIALYESLRELGYRVEARVMDGFRFGVPQHRQRLILIGLTDGRVPIWPDQDGGLVTLRDAIGDLPPIPRAQRAEVLPYDQGRIASEFQLSMRAGVELGEQDLIREHISRDVRPDDMEAFRILREGDTYVDLPERLQRYRSDVFTDKYKRLAWNELCRSITAHIAKDGYWYIHPEQHRTLSLREAARVQTFPDGFRFAGTQTHRYRQVGNAVPVLLGEAIGKAVRRAIDSPARPTSGTVDEFRRLLMDWHADAQPPTPPWRRGGSPWHVLVGELVLSRARHEDAAAIFERFVALAPTPSDLLDRPRAEDELVAIGLKERARLVVDVAAALRDRHHGEVPCDHMTLRELPGVGEYVCQAVLAFGFGRRTVLLDRTTSRIAARVSRTTDERRYQLRLDLHRLAGAEGPDPDFNKALLDLGRMICRVADPLCEQCPVRRRCRTGRVAEAAAPSLLSGETGEPSVEMAA